MQVYRHRQVGWVVLAALVAGVAVLAVAFALAGLWWPGMLIAAGFAATAALFGWLTVIVDEQSIVARFGVGIVQRHWAVDEVVAAKVVRNPWWTGWGIRWLPGKTVYNVSGFAAVEIELADGHTYRIGSDEPAALLVAIEGRRPGLA